MIVTDKQSITSEDIKQLKYSVKRNKRKHRHRRGTPKIIPFSKKIRALDGQTLTIADTVNPTEQVSPQKEFRGKVVRGGIVKALTFSSEIELLMADAWPMMGRRHRHCLYLSLIKGLTDPEISEMMGVTIWCAKQWHQAIRIKTGSRTARQTHAVLGIMYYQAVERMNIMRAKNPGG